MGKVLKSIAIAAVLVAVSFIPGIGPALSAALQAAAVGTVLAGVSQQLFAPKMPKSQIGRLNVTLDPSTPRKAIFGTTAMALDLRYHGTDLSKESCANITMGTNGSGTQSKYCGTAVVGTLSFALSGKDVK